jgi:hemoglobin-like flavoprotein
MSKEQAVISREIIGTVRERLNNTESMDNYLKGLADKQEIPRIISHYLKHVDHLLLDFEIEDIIGKENFKSLLISKEIAWEDKLTIIAVLMIKIENAIKTISHDPNFRRDANSEHIYREKRAGTDRKHWVPTLARKLSGEERSVLKQTVTSNLLNEPNSGIEFILGLIFLNKLQITEANVIPIINKLYDNNELWKELYSHLSNTGRNKEKGLLCGELYCTILKNLITLEELSDVDKNIVTQWSRYMASNSYTDEKIAFLEKADSELIEELIENGFVRANQGNAEVLNKLLDVVRDNIELLEKLIENGFARATQGNTDVLNELLDVVGDDIELLKKLIENGFVRSAKPKPGAESEPAVEPEQCPFKRLLKQLEQLSDNGNKDAFKCLTSLFPKRLSFQEITSSGLSEKTITAIFTQGKIARIVLGKLDPNNIQLADIKEAAGLGVSYLKSLVDFSKAKNIKTNYSDMVWVIKDQLNIDMNSDGIDALEIVITEEPTETTTLEVPDNKSNANKSILPLVGGATAGFAVGGLGAAAILSSASKIAFMRALQCYNIILPIAIVGAIIGSLIASQESQIER